MIYVFRFILFLNRIKITIMLLIYKLKWKRGKK